MNKKKTIYSVAVVALLLVWVMTLSVLGCHGDDNRVLTTDQVKKAQTDNIKNIESLNIPESSKKEMESHMGGPPYSNPAIDQAKAHGVEMAPGSRTH